MIPAAVGVPPGDRERQVRAADAVQQDLVGRAEQLTFRGVVTDDRRRGFMDLDERAAGGGELAEDRVERRRAGEHVRIVPPSDGVRADDSLLDGPVGQCGRRPPRLHRPVIPEQATVGDRVETGRLLARTPASTSASSDAPSASGGRGSPPRSVANIGAPPPDGAPASRA